MSDQDTLPESKAKMNMLYILNRCISALQDNRLGESGGKNTLMNSLEVIISTIGDTTPKSFIEKFIDKTSDYWYLIVVDVKIVGFDKAFSALKDNVGLLSSFLNDDICSKVQDVVYEPDIRDVIDDDFISDFFETMLCIIKFCVEYLEDGYDIYRPKYPVKIPSIPHLKSIIHHQHIIINSGKFDGIDINYWKMLIDYLNTSNSE